MFQELIIGLLLVAAVFFLVRTAVKSFKTGKSCASGCGKCGVEMESSARLPE
jgi:hypothetical protein